MKRTTEYKSFTSNPDANGILHKEKFGTTFVFAIEDDELTVEVGCRTPKEELEFAYYVYLDNVSIYEGGYIDSNHFFMKLTRYGNYSVRIFVKRKIDHYRHNDSFITKQLHYAPEEEAELRDLLERMQKLEKEIRERLGEEDISVEKLARTYRGKVWQLKEIAYDLPRGEERTLYEQAFYRLLEEKGSWISVDSKIGQYPIFPHGILGIFISGRAIIGKNAVIFQQVTIGSNTLADSKGNGAPIIGDNVYIGAGAKIIGNVKVGNNCRIGANAVITTDVPDNSVVVLNKPRIIHKEGMDNKFYSIRDGRYGYYLDGEFVSME